MTTYTETQTIIVCGDINADLTLDVPTFPAEGDDRAARDVIWGSGGAGLNAASAFALLGGNVRLLGRVGSDPAAHVALRMARQLGVDLSSVQQDSEIATGLCSVMVSGAGHRTMCTFRGANVTFELPPNAPDLLAGAGLLYLTAYALMEDPQRNAALLLCEEAEDQGIPLVLDLALQPIRYSRALLLDLLPRLWLLTMNEDELHLLLPGLTQAEALELLFSYGLPYVAIKRGERGCLLSDGSSYLEALPPAVTVVDTNGCGDAFAAGCAWALAQADDMHAGAALGNALGALTATQPGAADALPLRADLRDQLAPALHDLLPPPQDDDEDS
jgi:ribokinase